MLFLTTKTVKFLGDLNGILAKTATLVLRRFVALRLYDKIDRVGLLLEMFRLHLGVALRYLWGGSSCRVAVTA